MMWGAFEHEGITPWQVIPGCVNEVSYPAMLEDTKLEHSIRIWATNLAVSVCTTMPSSTVLDEP